VAQVHSVAKPAITVLVDTYNHERFIEEALVSVMEQDFSPADMEILVVDDGSTDRTPEIVRKFKPRVRLIRKKNGGQASAFNAGIPAAQGEIVAFLDGDDWWARNKLSRIVEVMSADAELGIVGHGIVIVHRDRSEQLETLREPLRFQSNTLEGVRLFRVRGSLLGTSRMTIRADLLRHIGLVPEALAVEADEYLFTLASVLAPAAILPDALTFYRLHDANAFLIAGDDPARVRHKQEALAALAGALEQQLRVHGATEDVVHAIVDIIQADADQLRLAIDGGWPWETVKTEWRIHRARYADTPLSYRAFKWLILGVASLTPPKAFYGAQRRLAQSGIYQRARERWLPVPKMPHFKSDWQAGS
jgi:glycosyltransferase involved in cell wall biosynthesis